MSDWLPIETATKDDQIEVLIWTGGSMYVATWAYDDLWQPEGLPALRPTHWMPLPEPPSSGSIGISRILGSDTFVTDR